MKTLTCCGPALLALALVACGGGESQRIVDACTEAISTKLADRSFELDPKDMLANVKPSGERQFELSAVSSDGVLVLDPALKGRFVSLPSPRSRSQVRHGDGHEDTPTVDALEMGMRSPGDARVQARGRSALLPAR